MDMSMMLEHNDDCVWRTKNNVDHNGVKNLNDCECDCHMGKWWDGENLSIILHFFNKCTRMCLDKYLEELDYKILNILFESKCIWTDR